MRVSDGESTVVTEKIHVCTYHKDCYNRIQALERWKEKKDITDAENSVMMKNLCAQIGALTRWLQALVVALVGASGTFMFWYFQKLGEKAMGG
jgi:hypothetical protein